MGSPVGVSGFEGLGFRPLHLLMQGLESELAFGLQALGAQDVGAKYPKKSDT